MKKPYKAFILAAGFGTRMRPITEEIPKPLVDVNGRSLLWRSLDNLRAFGTREVVVNAHYLAEKIDAHVRAYVKRYPDMHIHVSFEEGILDTGGGVLHALDFFDEDEPFFVIAGDNLWLDEGAVNRNGTDVIHTYASGIPPSEDVGSAQTPRMLRPDGRGLNGPYNNSDVSNHNCYGALERLAQGWDGQKMDIFTLMEPVSDMHVTKGVGDYDLLDDGRVRRSLEKSGAYMWTNIRLNHPRIYKGLEKEAFSFLELMDDAERSGRFFALEHEGEWHHVSTPDDLRAVDAHIRMLEGAI